MLNCTEIRLVRIALIHGDTGRTDMTKLIETLADLLQIGLVV